MRAAAFAISTVLIVGQMPETASAQPTSTESEYAASCEGDLCGQTLMRKGWRRDVGCSDGHTWSYLLVKDNRILFCEGINGRASPSELPCTDFHGDIEKYRAIAAKSRKELRGLGCFEGFGQ